jgi:hypothetical protein
MKLFGYYKALDLELWQPVTLEPGTRYRVTVPVFVDCYTWDKENKRKLPPNLHPGEPNKQAATMTISIVNIDDIPTCSPCFSEDSVENWYLNRHDITWEFTAQQADSHFVLRFYNPWPIQNNGWFFDGLRLEQVTKPPGNEPREQYARIYNVIHPDTPYEDALAVFAYCWKNGRQTVGGSYDDAGIGNLDDKTAVLWNIPDGDEPDYKDFFETYYPGTKLEFAYIGKDDPLGELLVCQCQEPWYAMRYDQGRCDTFCAQGCWISCVAIAQRYYGINPEATPLTVDDAMEDGDYVNCMFTWDAMKKQGLEVINSTTFKSHAKAHIDQGDLVFVEVTGLNHFVVAVSYSNVDDDFLVIDPYRCQVAMLKELYPGADSYRLIKRHQEEPSPPPDVGPTISFHEQGPERGLTEFVARTKPESFKLCHCPGEAKAIHHASPDTLIVFRKVYNAWHDYIYGYDDLMEAAQDFLDWMEPELIELESSISGRFAVEGLNETIATGALDDIRRVVEFECNFAYLLAQNFPRARPVLLNVAVGNPQHGSETQMLIPAARAAIETSGFLGYHAYWPAIDDESWLVSDWKHYAGRWAESWDVEFRNAGLRPHYLLTEGGPIGGSAWFDESENKWKPSLNAGAGWRHPSCLSGNWDKAYLQIQQFDGLARATIPGQEGRYHGIHLFTVSGGNEWRYFAYKERQFNDL